MVTEMTTPIVMLGTGKPRPSPIEEATGPDRDVLIEEISRDRDGRVVAANDLDVF